MSFLDIDTSNAVEPKPVPGDKEYKIRIVGYITKEDETTGNEEYMWPNKAGEPCFMPIFELTDHPNSKEFNTYMAIPTEDMSDKEQNEAAWGIEAFKKCFNIPAGKVDLKRTVGLEGWAIINLKSDAEYGEQNGIKKFILPK